MGTAIKHAVISGHYDAPGWATECPDVKNYKWWLNPLRHRMLYSCTHTATVGVKGLTVEEQYWKKAACVSYRFC